MKSVSAIFFFLLSIATSFAQDNQPWRSFFSYNHIIDISQSASRIYGAGESSIFYKNILTNELKTVTSVDGLKTDMVSAVLHSPTYNRTLVGNENGLLIVVNDDNSILNVIDIIEETTVAADKKKINHIFEYQGKAYLSCDFGIAVFNLETLEFGDTYYLGPNGNEIAVLQSTVHNGFIYAATAANGIRKADFSNPNLNDFNQWTEDTPGQWVGVVSFANNLFAANANGTLFKQQNGTFTFFSQQLGVLDLRATQNNMVVTASNNIDVFNDQLIRVKQIISIPGYAVNFTCATIINEKIYIGTYQEGLFTAYLNDTSVYEKISPNGPERNNIFSLDKTSGFLWAVFGGYNFYYTANHSTYGISKLTPQGWVTIPYNDVFGAKSLSDIAINPANQNDIYISSYVSGLLKIEDETPIKLFDNTNTGTDGLRKRTDNNTVPINGPSFDKNGNIWMTNAGIEKPLKLFKPANNQWTSYSFQDIVTNIPGEAYGRMVIDKNNTKWIPCLNSGIIAFNETMGNRFVVISEGSGNLPTPYVKCLAIDNRNQLWIGTVRGLRVLSSVDSFTTDTVLTTNPIIIMEDDVAQELMYEQAIIDIAVDGANNKWIATSAAGAFLVSPNGQETLAHFTKENSPLPSNSINDIEIDAATGEVFFATDRGMVSYKGTSTEAEDNFNNVYVFPNPVRPGFEGDVNISGLMNKANVKITDIEGNLVYETTSEGGTVLWDTRAFGKYKVASGVYMIFLASDDASQTKVKKVMIIR
jgi:ligand-binding sensor domain-containing protein